MSSKSSIKQPHASSNGSANTKPTSHSLKGSSTSALASKSAGAVSSSVWNKSTTADTTEQKPKTTDGRNPHATPRRVVGRALGKVGGRARDKIKPRLERPCQQHSFLSDVTDVRQMEQGLLQLLEDFHSGKLQAFGQDCSFGKMEGVREQQEKLARLHFDLGTQQEAYGPHSEDGRTVAKDNLTKLMENLQQLSLAVEDLHSGNFVLQTDV